MWKSDRHNSPPAGRRQKFAIFVFILLILPLLAGCRKSPDEQFSSDLKRAISLSSETELFLDVLGKQQSGSSFEAGHARYLAESARELSDDLAQHSSNGDDLKKFSEAQSAITELASVLQTIQSGETGGPRSSELGARCEEIRRRLEQLGHTS
jgi:hypothetical protein